MARRVSACFACFLVFSLLAILSGPVPADATTYLFTATWNPGSEGTNSWSSFSFQYNDNNPVDGKVSLTEINMSTFTGVTKKDSSGTVLFYSDTIYGVPVPPALQPDNVFPKDPVILADQITVGSGTGSGGEMIPPQLCYAWNFAPGTHGSDIGMAGVLYFTESQVVVPIPPTALLLGSGLLGLVGWRRFRKS
jgi:hypothetical protein